MTGARDDLSLDLVRRIQRGDGAAWDALYLRYRDRLLFSIRCRLGPALRRRLESEDVLHSVVRDAIEGLREFEPQGPNALSHYLHVCVLNKIRKKAEYWGAQKRRGDATLSPSLAERLPGGDAPPDYADSERFERLERALARLDGDHREVILLRRIEGLTNAEAARVMERSEAATSKLHARAMARLGSALQREPRT